MVGLMAPHSKRPNAKVLKQYAPQKSSHFVRFKDSKDLEKGMFENVSKQSPREVEEDAKAKSQGLKKYLVSRYAANSPHYAYGKNKTDAAKRVGIKEIHAEDMAAVPYHRDVHAKMSSGGEEKKFDLNDEQSFKKAEKYKEQLENRGYRVTTRTHDLNGVTIKGERSSSARTSSEDDFKQIPTRGGGYTTPAHERGLAAVRKHNAEHDVEYVDEKGRVYKTERAAEQHSAVYVTQQKIGKRPESEYEENKHDHRLTYEERQALSPREFAEPGERKYPIEDESHARNALSRVSQFGTPSEKRMVRAAVAKRYPEIKQSHDGRKDPDVVVHAKDERYAK
jgi:hypothetical protein